MKVSKQQVGTIAGKTALVIINSSNVDINVMITMVTLFYFPKQIN